MFTKLPVRTAIAFLLILGNFSLANARVPIFKVNVEIDSGMVLNAQHEYRAENQFIPVCAEGYLGGHSRGISEYKPIPITPLKDLAFGRKGWLIMAEMPEEDPTIWDLCDFRYYSSFIMIAPENTPACGYEDADHRNPEDCVWPTSVRFTPMAEEQTIKLNCRIEVESRSQGTVSRVLRCLAE